MRKIIYIFSYIMVTGISLFAAVVSQSDELPIFQVPEAAALPLFLTGFCFMIIAGWVKKSGR